VKSLKHSKKVLKRITNIPDREKVEKVIVMPKKELIDNIGQKIDHTLRFGSTQFGLCTENTYNELLEKI